MLAEIVSLRDSDREDDLGRGLSATHLSEIYTRIILTKREAVEPLRATGCPSRHALLSPYAHA
jgi:hypothetical protein